MNLGVPLSNESPRGGSPAASRRSRHWGHARTMCAGALGTSLVAGLLFAGSALGATATVELGTTSSFSVLAGSTITNIGPTTMSGDLGLSPGTSVTGAPQVLGQTHVDDAVAIGAKSSLTTAFNDAASRPSTGSAGADRAGQSFLPGVRTASSSLLLSSGAVTLNAQGDPNAVFIFQIGTTLTTGSATKVLLINGAQACNVFWEVGSSATLGTGTQFVGTIMAGESITAGTASTIEGRLLAQTAAVTLESNTITTSACASQTGGEHEGGTPEETKGTPTPEEAKGSPTPVTGPVAGSPGVASGAPSGATTPARPIASKTTIKHRRKARRHKAHKAHKSHSPARPALSHKHGAFTG